MKYGIPLSDLAHMMGVSRKTLSEIKNNKIKISAKMKILFAKFAESWKWEETHKVFTREPFIKSLDDYTISPTGYLYKNKRQRKNIRIQNEYPDIPLKNDFTTTLRLNVAKSLHDAIKFHGDKVKLPKYDTWFTCVKCEFRVLGRVRSRLKTPGCPICGNLVRPCMDCVHYVNCANQKDCFYRRRTDGIKCRNCGRMVSQNANSIYQCGCGYINSWKDSTEFAKINKENGF